MTDPTTAPEDSALRPAESDLHPADPTDDLTGNTPGADDVRGPDPAAPLPGDTLPGDGSVAHDRPEQPDAMRTAYRSSSASRQSRPAQPAEEGDAALPRHGRGTAVPADLSDDRPTPTATPAD